MGAGKKWRISLLPLLVLSPPALAEKPAKIDVGTYWLMPNGLVAKTCNLTWKGGIIFGEHCFWSGDFLGRHCYLQGDPSMTKFDICEVAEGTILYWGTFRGNSPDDPVSHSFRSPMLWMRERMSVGESVTTQVPVVVLNPGTRAVEHEGMIEMRLQIDAHHDEWTIPETGVAYRDVIEISFWSDAKRPESKEVYHLARGKGTIRFDSSNAGEPSGVRVAWAVGFYEKEFAKPTVPWFDVFGTGKEHQPRNLHHEIDP